MNIQELKRVFKYNDVDLPDPDPSLSPQRVVELYSNTYPEMVTAVAIEKDINDATNTIEYEISSNLGTKG